MTLWIGVALLSVGLMASLTIAILNRRLEQGVSRWAPELHVVAILLSSAGAWLAWGWLVALGVAAGHLLLAFLIVRSEA